MALEVSAALATVERLPTTLYGHCMGGLVAYETALLLAREDFPVERLVVAAQAAPSVASGRDREDLGITAMASDQFWSAVREGGGIPDEVFRHPPLLRLLEPTLRADWDATERYRGPDQDQLDCPVVAVRGIGDPLVSREELELWGDFTSVGATVVEIEGDHFLATPESLAAILPLATGGPAARASSLLSVDEN
jgi:medium-chain acyl-[acyl-carrier-protein] hydrolase